MLRLQQHVGCHFFITLFNNIESPWESSLFASTLSLLYLGVIATGFVWLIRFRILTDNGLVFQTQVAYLIPILELFLDINHG